MKLPPEFDIRPVIEVGKDCQSFSSEESYKSALKDLLEDEKSPSFSTFWTVYLLDDVGCSSAVADRSSKQSALLLVASLASLKTEPNRSLAINAACVWEAIVDGSCENNALWEGWRSDLGSCEMRDQVYDLAVWVQQVYDECIKQDAETTQGHPFDWDFVPAALGFIKCPSEDKYPGPDDYPKPDEIAPQVLAKLS
ncbi:hypothetical protein PsAD2_02999 [Pseudovibrio axinellae]|uniref:Uncharacterized protein n=1 Tax=Pseudovibrio axinellae TaxID=989403 RepID=A0A165XFQ6_9HYPH|nr:hypothetical protein [Pseudovibrio axinellae]KZL17663.1 hypothetical protein PsAD2_02999 [Pseudovibrio axinellae]SER44506.1 hypothetical protein SAMN05421798_11083 [Pseudovibrio axinellae]